MNPNPPHKSPFQININPQPSLRQSHHRPLVRLSGRPSHQPGTGPYSTDTLSPGLPATISQASQSARVPQTCPNLANVAPKPGKPGTFQVHAHHDTPKNTWKLWGRTKHRRNCRDDRPTDRARMIVIIMVIYYLRASRCLLYRMACPCSLGPLDQIGGHVVSLPSSTARYSHLHRYVVPVTSIASGALDAARRMGHEKGFAFFAVMR